MRDVLCILAGGRSSRFGGSKLAVEIEGEPVLAWLVRRLGPAVSGCWLNVSPAHPLPPTSDHFEQVVHDDQAFAGPLGGMVSVLRAASAADVARVVFLAADMPLIEQPDVARLLDVLATDDAAAGAMYRWSAGPRGGEIEPLPSAWRVDPALGLLNQAMSEGVRGPSRLAAYPAVRSLPLLPEQAAIRWRSINTREDMEAVSRAAGVRMEVR